MYQLIAQNESPLNEQFFSLYSHVQATLNSDKDEPNFNLNSKRGARQLIQTLILNSSQLIKSLSD